MSHFIEGKSVTGENIFSETDMFGENKIAAKWLFQSLSCRRRRRRRKWVSLVGIYGYLCSQDLGIWRRAPELPLAPAELMKIGIICCTSGLASHAVPSSLNISGQGEVTRQLLETATLELTKWCFNSSFSKFFPILKISSFSLLGVVAAALCAPKILELGLNQCNILVGMGEMGDQGTPNHRIVEPMRLGKISNIMESNL